MSHVGVREHSEAALAARPSEPGLRRPRRQGARLGAFLLVLVAVTALAPQRPSRPPRGQDGPWAAHLRRMEGALAAGDVRNATRAWDEAYGAALRIGGWEGMAAAGEASVRLGEGTGRREDAASKARGIFQLALARAQRQESPEGVLRAAEAFAGLGDFALADLCLGVAKGLAGKHPDPQVRERIRALQDRVASQSSRAGHPHVGAF